MIPAAWRFYASHLVTFNDCRAVDGQRLLGVMLLGHVSLTRVSKRSSRAILAPSASFLPPV